MAVEVILPKVDMVMETGTFVEWFKQEGQQVVKGEPLFTILTDKAAIEIESPASGILAGVSAKPNDVIPVSETIAYILAPGEQQPERRSGAFTTSNTAGAAPSAVPAETLSWGSGYRAGSFSGSPSGQGACVSRGAPYGRRVGFGPEHAVRARPARAYPTR